MLSSRTWTLIPCQFTTSRHFDDVIGVVVASLMLGYSSHSGIALLQMHDCRC